KAQHYKTYANMWRITDDFWDDWKFLKAMFERCEVWQKHSGDGNWPDCDMLPMGKLGYGWAPADAEHKGWDCKFSSEETKTMLTLWSIFRAPLMIGTDLPQLSKENLEFLSNDEIIAMNKCSNQAEQTTASTNENIVEWINECDDEDNAFYSCLFNLSEQDQTVKLNFQVGKNDNIRDLWEHKDLGASTEFVLKPHCCKAFKINLTAIEE
ncbi:MAG: hypothetical protein MJ162_04375, partial [Treponema sp.]|nr:hypothetical protein [Treponema sp.]